MDYFYKYCVHILFRPLHNLSEWRVVKGNHVFYFAVAIDPDGNFHRTSFSSDTGRDESFRLPL